MTQTPTLGRLVHVLVDPSSNNGSDVASAVITRVWNPEAVNLRIFHDVSTSAEVGAASSVKLHPSEAAARDHLAKHVAQQKEIHGIDHIVDLKHVNHAFWPAHIETPAEPAPDEEPPHTTETADAVD